ncbi:MAG: hypothetical protein O8C58_05135, partial [Candidatus Methanoperedens sp.]|nr:hypothetical protein [Candidatus Methanoperedens sp.]
EDRVGKAVAQAISTPLLDVRDISSSYGVLVHIVGGEDLTLEEVAVAGELIMDKVSNTKRIIWGAKVDNNLTGSVRVMAVLTGVESPFISGETVQPRREEVVEEPEPVIVRPKVEAPKPKPVTRIEPQKSETKPKKAEKEKESYAYVWYILILIIILGLLWRFM